MSRGTISKWIAAYFGAALLIGVIGELTTPGMVGWRLAATPGARRRKKSASVHSPCVRNDRRS